MKMIEEKEMKIAIMHTVICFNTENVVCKIYLTIKYIVTTLLNKECSVSLMKQQAAVAMT